MWEIIKKNKQKSAIALSVMGVWYCVIYGLIITILIITVLSYFSVDRVGIYNYLSENSILILPLFLLGIFLALLIFTLKFSSISNKPYEMNGCGIYPINKRKYKQVYNIVEEVAIASGIGTIPRIYILDSDILNAYACGFKPEKSSIVISKKLIEVLSRDELQGVIAHEMSHIINRDTTYLLCSGALFAISAAFSAFFYSGMRGRGKGAAFFAILFLISILGQGVCFILMMFISRKREYLADACAAQYTRYPKGLADALLKIEKGVSSKKIENPDNLIKASFIAPLDKKDDWRSTHPSTQNRIKILLNMTSADYGEYEKEFQKLNNKKLIPQSAIQNTEKIAIKQVQEIKIEPIVAAACALNDTITGNEDIRIIKENKEILDKNIQKHREVENLVRDLAGYSTIDCDCGTKLKIPPVYKNQIIICPHCKKKHAVK